MIILRAILTMLLATVCVLPAPVQARTAQARIARMISPVATLQDVRIDLAWPSRASAGVMRLQARRLDAPGLDYHFQQLDWTCDLRRSGWSTWRCSGPVRAGRGASMDLSVDITERGVDASLARGTSRIAVQRRGDAPDLTRVDLTSIPLAWTRALLAQAWPEAQLKGGNGDARLQVTSSAAGVRVAGPLTLRGVALDTPDGRIAAEGLGGAFDLDLLLGPTDRVALRGALQGGEILFGTTYVALAGRRVGLDLDAEQRGACCWRLPRFDWRDGNLLAARGQLAFGPGLALRDIDVDLRSENLAGARDAYLSGWLGAAGMAGLELRGGLAAKLSVVAGRLERVDARLDSISARDPKGRFAFESLAGDAKYSADGPVRSGFSWKGGSVYGLAFGPASVPLTSAGGRLSLAHPVDVPMLGGRFSFDHLAIQPASTGQPALTEFGLTLERLDVAQVAKALGLPAFTGQLSGRIPSARYSSDTLVFDGGLSTQVFGGRIDVSALSMERPFGVAPTLGADIAIDDLDLASVTGVLGFGSITGLLDGRISALRLVDWQPVAFDASLRTDRRRGVRQRISQRAVQDLSSVGDNSLVSGLQAQLLGFFDDFGYSRIGIDCRLADGVCDMGGLAASGPNSFVIVRGAGIPRLSVIGINRRVDWQTLVERLVAVGKGETKAIVR
ncbi:MAG: hypothetical protein EPO46_10070 [Lysobacter sp.]|nr:MAG: hypothetical protein EPO46_10070 [Lysobacter sp.]